MKLKLIALCALAVSACCKGPAEETVSWAPAGERIMSQWAEQVSPDNALPEYPRPAMVRDNWQNLNGMWKYEITAQDAPQPEVFSKDILVPYPLESALSGVADSLKADQALWYKETFEFPKKWTTKKNLLTNDIILNFGAVDYQCEIWFNGQYYGEHKGGFTAFSIKLAMNDIKTRGEQELVLKVIDRTDDNTQPRGKQVMRPRGIWYTPVSGIWQTVWAENAPVCRIEDYKTEYKDGVLKVYAKADKADKVLVELLKGAVGYDPENPGTEVIASAEITDLSKAAEFKIENPELWSTDSPYLYGLQLTAKKEDKVTDKVSGYTALRTISMVKDADGHFRMALNDKPLFQYGPLDQGWWPDGLYTAPTDEALRFDVQKTKDFGYNMIRKHIKVEPERWYFHCDQLGMLVWQDMPSITDSRFNRWNTKEWGGGTDWQAPAEVKETYYKEWGEIMTQFMNHPSIVVWVPFNEAWAQFDTEKAVEFTRNLDPSRLINPASGGNFVKGIGDIVDCHNYPAPDLPVWDDEKVNVLGEYGGIGLPLEGHLWRQGKNWGYIQFKSGDEVLSEYAKYAEILKEWVKKGCSAAVYTQTTDVEGEVNGLMTYDRKVIKMDEAKLREVNLSVIEAMN